MKNIDLHVSDTTTLETGKNRYLNMARKFGSGVIFAVLAVGGVVATEQSLNVVSNHNPDFDVEGILTDLPAK